MRILYIGQAYGTSAHRAEALRRLGHVVKHLDPQEAIPSSRWVTSFNIRTGYRLFETRVRHHMLRAIRQQQFDLAWINGGSQLGVAFYQGLAHSVARIISYNNDDPFGKHDKRKWDLYKQSVRFHDVTVVVRTTNIGEARAHGAKRALRVFMSYDPLAHASLPLSAEEQRKWSSEVIFVGSWMPERGPFLTRLLQCGVPLSIYGDRWHKAPEWHFLKSTFRGRGLTGSDYAKAIRGSKVALGLLSISNRDLHTQRSCEIPFIGGTVFCGQRTSEHLAMYREGQEALFWSSAQECASQCHKALGDSALRERLSAGAHRRIIQMGLSNDETISWVLNSVQESSGEIERPLPKHQVSLN